MHTTKLRLILAAMILGSGIAGRDGSVVGVALPKIAGDLHAGYNGLQWIVDGYMLTLSALILLGGSLGDVVGRKQVFIGGLIGFGITSALCGLAPSITTLIIFRMLQGAAAALLVPSSLAIINTSFPVELRAQAIAQWTALMGVMIAAGPLIGGLILDHTTWRWIFLINVPLVAVCAYIAQMSIEKDQRAAGRIIDWTGAALAMIGLGGVTYGLIQGPATNWEGFTIPALLIGMLSLGLFALEERRSKQPMIDFNLFRNPTFTGANLATFAMYGALSGSLFVLIPYLQTGLHYSSLLAGTAAIPITILMMLFAPRIGKAAGIYGPRWFMVVGPVINGLGLLYLLRLNPEHSSYLIDLFPGILLFGAGLTITVAPLTAAVMSSIPERESGVGSAINNAVSRVAGLLVVALLGIAVAHVSSTSTDVISAANASYRLSMAICAGLAIAAGAISFVTIHRPKASANDQS